MPGCLSASGLARNELRKAGDCFCSAPGSPTPQQSTKEPEDPLLPSGDVTPDCNCSRISELIGWVSLTPARLGPACPQCLNPGKDARMSPGPPGLQAGTVGIQSSGVPCCPDRPHSRVAPRKHPCSPGADRARAGYAARPPLHREPILTRGLGTGAGKPASNMMK